MRKKTAAIVLADGKGTRVGRNVPKQYINVGGYPLIYYSLKAINDSFIDEIILVCGEDDREYCSTEIVEKYGFTKVKSIAAGGRERYHSVYNGLTSLRCVAEGEGNDPCDIVFIHDGARPFVNDQILERAYEAAEKYRAAVVAVPAKDTVKLADGEGFAVETLDRNRLWLMQTPQVFDIQLLKAANCQPYTPAFTDDASVAEAYGQVVTLVDGNRENIKLTTPFDLKIAETLL